MAAEKARLEREIPELKDFKEKNEKLEEELQKLRQSQAQLEKEMEVWILCSLINSYPSLEIRKEKERKTWRRSSSSSVSEEISNSFAHTIFYEKGGNGRRRL